MPDVYPFYGGSFSQWKHAPFEVGGITFRTAEHWMMAEKARLFFDDDSMARILADPAPWEAKALGRKVRGFDHAVWRLHRESVVTRGNLYKFRAHPDLAAELLATGDAILAEASPRDSVWGTGLAAAATLRTPPDRWPGTNLLGKCLMTVREKLREGVIFSLDLGEKNRLLSEHTLEGAPWRNGNGSVEPTTSWVTHLGSRRQPAWLTLPERPNSSAPAPRLDSSTASTSSRLGRTASSLPTTTTSPASKRTGLPREIAPMATETTMEKAAVGATYQTPKGHEVIALPETGKVRVIATGKIVALPLSQVLIDPNDLLHVSISQLGTFESCPRLWHFTKIQGFEAPQGAAAKEGDRIHKLGEDYSLGIAPAPTSGAGAEVALYYPPPGPDGKVQPNVYIEKDFRVAYAGGILRGRIDVLGMGSPTWGPKMPPQRMGARFVDLKTVNAKSWSYVKTEAQLRQGRQLRAYFRAMGIMGLVPPLAEVGQVAVTRDAPHMSKATLVEIGEKHASEQEEKDAVIVERMIAARAVPAEEILSLPKAGEERLCLKHYGPDPCPFYARCYGAPKATRSLKDLLDSSAGRGAAATSSAIDNLAWKPAVESERLAALGAAFIEVFGNKQKGDDEMINPPDAAKHQEARPEGGLIRIRQTVLGGNSYIAIQGDRNDAHWEFRGYGDSWKVLVGADLDVADSGGGFHHINDETARVVAQGQRDDVASLDIELWRQIYMPVLLAWDAKVAPKEAAAPAAQGQQVDEDDLFGDAKKAADAAASGQSADQPAPGDRAKLVAELCSAGITELKASNLVNAGYTMERIRSGEVSQAMLEAVPTIGEKYATKILSDLVKPKAEEKAAGISDARQRLRDLAIKGGLAADEALTKAKAEDPFAELGGSDKIEIKNAAGDVVAETDPKVEYDPVKEVTVNLNPLAAAQYKAYEGEKSNSQLIEEGLAEAMERAQTTPPNPLLVRGFWLYLDCRPIKGLNATPFNEVVAPFLAAVAKAHRVVDVSCLKAYEWPGLVSEQLHASRATGALVPGAIVVDTRDDVWQKTQRFWLDRAAVIIQG